MNSILNVIILYDINVLFDDLFNNLVSQILNFSSNYLIV